MQLFESLRETLRPPTIRLLGLVWSIIYYLVEPDAAFLAVWIAVMLDLVSKLVAISAQKGGFMVALTAGEISSKKAFRGTFIKLVAYFTLGVLCAQVEHVAGTEVVAVMSKTLVYGFLFTVESISILENLVAAGLPNLAPLLAQLRRAARREAE
ncbi:MAG: phage holin family protein [Firmicutes bacterium]|nr:phage holin family protein [Dethiobacter sp.]MBS3887905.1 phage holin family protein [Bacillota bacterium]MBS4054255.1 phage holin family protein [Thermaerobacter sp.]